MRTVLLLELLLVDGTELNHQVTQEGTLAGVHVTADHYVDVVFSFFDVLLWTKLTQSNMWYSISGYGSLP